MNNNPFEAITERLDSIESMLNDLKQPVRGNSTDSDDRWLDLKEVVAYDPARRTKPTWYGYVAAKKVPYHKNGKQLYFLKSEIDAWLKSGRKKTAQEIKDEAHTYVTKR